MKAKGYCQSCGRYMQSCSLKKEIKGERLLCSNCYKFKNVERLHSKLDNLPEINSSVDKLPIKKDFFDSRAISGKGTYGLLRGEDEVLKNKYNGSVSQLQRLRTALKFKKKEVKMVKEKLNEKFLEGLK